MASSLDSTQLLQFILLQLIFILFNIGEGSDSASSSVSVEVASMAVPLQIDSLACLATMVDFLPTHYSCQPYHLVTLVPQS